PVLYLSSSLSPPPLCLSVPSAAPPPDLPSSPTRRSSDLFCPIASVAYPPRAARGRRGAARSPPHRLPDGRRGGPRRVAPGRRERDRKSTRLNSSHVSISYAVFCLKKKKMQRRAAALVTKR